MSILEIIKKTFRVNQKPQKPQKPLIMPEANQIWLYPDDLIDRYCTPIILSVVKVADGTVFYVSNFSKKISEKKIEDFQKEYTFHIKK